VITSLFLFVSSHCMPHRCDALSSLSKIEFTENIKGLTEWQHSWPDGEITYRLNNYTGDIAKAELQDRAVTVALRSWQLYINKLKFRRERSPDTTVDFDISFEPLSHFDNRKGVLAHAYFPGQDPTSGNCHINDEWNWTTHSALQRMNTPPLVPILIHEFGHSLGLRHDTTDKCAIMWPSFSIG